MGDPKKQRKKYATPSHPWRLERIEEEKGLTAEFGLKNKKEIWRADAILRKVKQQAKRMIRGSGQQVEREKNLMINKLFSMSLIEKDAKIEDILELNIKNVLERRLQTQVCRKKLAGTVNQARQFVIHGHVFVKGNKVTIPSYFVLRGEEDAITFSPNSKLSKEEHPMRMKEKVEVKTQLKIVKKPEVKEEVAVKAEEVAEGELKNA
ncbi:30S ribosomal protein S4 [Candidatus Woesearchaeota archaeon]|nr:30S ribosomal protein S4 [Candidatus Woesearchaeota archaeon]